MQLLATTNPGLESVAAEEIADLVGADPTHRYRGAVTFEADESAVYALNRRGRSLHRVQLLLRDREFEDLEGIQATVADLPIERYVDPDQTFGIRATRHGDHEFTSPEVGDVCGQAVIDAYREATGTRLTVDLDDPDVIFRAFVREDHFYFALDATGAESLHRRWYRECEHNAPLRPTIAHSLLRLADFGPDDSLVDPTCGSATVPIEAALYALDRPPHRDGTYADERLPCLSAPGSVDVDPGFAPADPDDLSVRGIDVRDRWVRCGRVNVRAADLGGVVDVESGDATEADLDADVVVANLPYGIRTAAGDVPTLYRDLSANLRDSAWRTFVGLTTRPDLLELPVERTLPITYGRLEASVVVARQ